LELNDEVTIDLWEEILRNGNDFRFRAFGVSMLPLIREKDILIIEPAKITDLSVGDIILYKDGGKPFVHRIIKKKVSQNTTICITKGDYMHQPDQPINSSQILGKLTYLERNDKKIHFNTFGMKKFGFLTALLYPLTFPVINTSVKILSFKNNFKHNLDSFTLYRKIKRIKAPETIKYEIVSDDKLSSFVKFYKSDVKSIKESIKMGNIYFQAKISNQTIAAVVVSEFWKDICPDKYWIMGLYVKPEYRGRGIGENLIRITISEMENKSLDKVYINVFENNIPALKLYKKMGFKPYNNNKIADKIDNYYYETDPNSPKSLIFSLKL
jgi:ribosomal protein S18 acetylase RimI-like enzyme